MAEWEVVIEVFDENQTWSRTRRLEVPGGWLYQHLATSNVRGFQNQYTIVFVPAVTNPVEFLRKRE